MPVDIWVKKHVRIYFGNNDRKCGEATGLKSLVSSGKWLEGDKW